MSQVITGSATEIAMQKRKFGSLEVSEIGFGTMSFASSYGSSPEPMEAVRTIQGARLPEAILKLSYK